MIPQREAASVRLRLESSAPHIWPATDWRSVATHDEGLVLLRSADDSVMAGVRCWPAGENVIRTERDMLCYFQRGSGVFRRDSGEVIEISPGMAVHFKTGTVGTIGTAEAIEATYMMCDGGSASQTPVLGNVLTASPLKDWGAVPTMIDGESRTAGILLSREANGRAESGIWTCTPGIWRCEVTSDEYCHFLEGSCTYTHESGEVIEIEPDTLAFFPQEWRGRCEVRRTIRKVYMIR